MKKNKVPDPINKCRLDYLKQLIISHVIHPGAVHLPFLMALNNSSCVLSAYDGVLIHVLEGSQSLPVELTFPAQSSPQLVRNQY